MKPRKTAPVICCLAFSMISNCAFSMNCSTPQSTISDQWIINTTIAQILVGLMQVVGSSASFIGDYVFYIRRPIKEVEEKIQELSDERDKYLGLKEKKPKILRAIFSDISNFLKEHADNIQNDKELIIIFQHIKDVLDKFALEPDSPNVGEIVL